MRIVAALFGLVVMLTSISVAAAPQADASSDGDPCTFYVAVPRTFAISSAAGPRMYLRGDCPLADSWFASGKLIDRNGKYVKGTRADFDGCDQYSSLDCYEGTTYNDTRRIKLTTPGTFAAVAYAGLAEDYVNCYDQVYCFYDVGYGRARVITAKYLTRSALTVTRRAGVRHFTLTASHYSPKARRMVRGHVAEIDLQRQNKSGDWITQKRLSSNSAGVATYSTRIGSHRWRAFVPATSTRWAARSRPVTA